MAISDIKRVGVVGSGLMGHGIALSFALHGYPVMMHDLSAAVLVDAMGRARATAELFLEEGLISNEEAEAALARMATTTDLAALAHSSDFVTEAIVERTEDKRSMFNDLDRLCPARTIIASNTSSLVLSDFGREVARQDRIVITHYFSPPALVPGVEVARGPGTSEETYETTCQLMSRIHHVPIRVLKEMPGYLLNRIQAAAAGEAYRLWAEGVASAEDIDLGVRTTFGFRMPQEGPMMHFDLAGVWKWPEDVRKKMGERHFDRPEWGDDAAQRIRARYAEGTPWFSSSAGNEEALLERDRQYIRRLKSSYWSS